MLKVLNNGLFDNKFVLYQSFDKQHHVTQDQGTAMMLTLAQLTTTEVKVTWLWLSADLW